jgi:hypothetical protein
MLVITARAGLRLADNIRSTRGKLYSDGFHKAVTAEIAALNTTQNACGKVIVRDAMHTKAIGLTDLDVRKVIAERAVQEADSRE